MQSFLTASFIALTLLSPLIESATPAPAFSESYAPVYVDCPPDIEWIRPADGLGAAERDWVHERKRVVLGALEAYLGRLKMEKFDVSKYVRDLRKKNYADVPTIGLAISGGGFASAFTGTGALRALDARLEAAKKQRTGGLLQSMTYMSGLSGGGFPIMSFATHNFPTADEIVDLWHPAIDRLAYEKNTKYTATAESVFEDLGAKAEAGFNVSIADFLGISWAYEFVPGPQGGLNTTLSSVANLSSFKRHQMPFPILQAVQITEDDPEYFDVRIPTASSVNIEMTPFEFGAWDDPIEAFSPTQWLGTGLYNGFVINGSACVLGFDRASFIMGTAGDAFNFWYIENKSNGTIATFAKRSEHLPIPSKQRSLHKRLVLFPEATIDSLEEGFGEAFNETVSDFSYAYYPNPFFGTSETTPSQLTLADGSEGGQTIPLWAQIQPARAPNFIIAWDSSQDAQPYSWNNGTNLYNTFLAANASGIPFPIIPSAATFVRNNYTSRPVFFGCDVGLTTTHSADAPIILYLANAPYSAYTNFSFVQSATTRAQMAEIFTNSFDLLTQGNGTLDMEWPVCLGCAAVDRSLPKVGMYRTEQCQRCFERYCWGGIAGEGETGVVDLKLVLDPELGFVEWNRTHPF